jgi:hypothetical protein
VKGESPTVGVTTWLMTDFTGVKTVESVRNLARMFHAEYQQVKRDIDWNTNYQGKPPESKRGKTSRKKKNAPDKNIKIPIWNTNKRKILMGSKIFQCESLKKPDVIGMAKKLNVSHLGFKLDICQRIVNKIKKVDNSNISVPEWKARRSKIPGVYGRYYQNGRIYNCYRKSSDQVRKLAIKLGVNEKGKKADVCERIKRKLNSNRL